jgi:hypothetical protein
MMKFKARPDDPLHEFGCFLLDPVAAGHPVDKDETFLAVRPGTR